MRCMSGLCKVYCGTEGVGGAIEAGRGQLGGKQIYNTNKIHTILVLRRLTYNQFFSSVAQVLLAGRRAEGLRAVRAAWRDFRRGQLGPRPSSDL